MTVEDALESLFVKYIPATQYRKPAPETLLSDLGIDSLGFIELIADIETEFNLNISNEDVDKLKTVGDVIELVSGMTE